MQSPTGCQHLPWGKGTAHNKQHLLSWRCSQGTLLTAGFSSSHTESIKPSPGRAHGQFQKLVSMQSRLHDLLINLLLFITCKRLMLPQLQLNASAASTKEPKMFPSRWEEGCFGPEDTRSSTYNTASVQCKQQQNYNHFIWRVHPGPEQQLASRQSSKQSVLREQVLHSSVR